MAERDRYHWMYSQRTHHMGGSEIRALFSVLDRPEIISLAGGNTYTDLVAGRVSECVQAVLDRYAKTALQYGPGNGLLPLREQIVALMAREGIEATSHQVVIMDGAQQALDLVAKILIDPGDVILTEAPTYVGALSAFGAYESEIRSVPSDAGGILPDDLERALSRLAASGRRAKFLYLVPTFQNPSGVTLEPGRRLIVAEICEKADLLIVEDNPYAQVRFEGNPVVPIRVIAPDQTLYLGTLSKVFSPGLRIGWVVAPEALSDRLILAKEAANLCGSAFNQLVAAEYLSSPHLDDDLAIVRKVYRERCHTMLDAIASHFPASAQCRPPEGGLFVWVTLPEVDTQAMLARALSAGVAYVPGTAFYPIKSDGQFSLRLNFSYPSADEISEGVRRLGKVISDELGLVRALQL